MNTAAKVRINFELANKPIENLHIKQLFNIYFTFTRQIGEKNLMFLLQLREYLSCYAILL
jgi:hypothetical protein